MRAQVVFPLSLSFALLGLALPVQAQGTTVPNDAVSEAQEDPAEANGDEAAPDDPTSEAKKPAAKSDKGKDAAASTNANPALVGLASGGEGGDAFPLHIQASLTNQVGQGTFVFDSTNNASVISSLSVAPRFQWGPFNIMLRQNIMFEWTPPDNATGRRFDWFDTSIDANYIIPVGSTGLLVGLRGGARLPLSMISRNQGRLIGLTGRVNLIYSTPLPGLVLIGGLGGQGNVNIPAWRGAGFFGTGNGTGKPFENSLGDQQAASTCLVRGGELAADACARLGNIGTVSGVGIVSYSIGQFNFSGVISAFTLIRDYWGPDDEFTSPNAKPGLAHTPLTNGDISVNWTPISWFTLTGGVTSFQPMFDAANQWPRFPFWDFIAMRDNYSSVYMTTTFSY